MKEKGVGNEQTIQQLLDPCAAERIGRHEEAFRNINTGVETLKTDLKSEMKDLREEYKEGHNDIKVELKEFRGEIKDDIKSVVGLMEKSLIMFQSNFDKQMEKQNELIEKIIIKHEDLEGRLITQEKKMGIVELFVSSIQDMIDIAKKRGWDVFKVTGLALIIWFVITTFSHMFKIVP
jgi:esterase/lipase